MAKSQGQSLGTRGAVIFGDQASSGLERNLSYIEQADRRRQQEAAAQAQRLSQSWRDNALKADSGNLWREEIGAAEQQHINKGIELRNKGIDPYNSLDPRAQEFRLERQKVLDMRARRSALENDWNIQNKAIRTNMEKYRPEDIEAFNNFVANTPFSEVYSNNLEIPRLRERFNVTTEIKDINPVLTGGTVIEGNEKVTRKSIDRPATERSILGRLNSTDNGREYLQTISGGFSIPELRNAPSTIEDTEKLVIGLYDSDPSIRESLAVNGIVSKEDPRFQEYVQSESQRRLNAKINFERELGNLVDSRIEGVTETESRTPDYTAEDRAWSRESRNMQRTRFAERNNTKSSGGGGSDEDSGEFRKGYIPYQGFQGGKQVVVNAPMEDSRNVKIPASRISTTEAWDLSKGGERFNPKRVLKGDVSRLGQVPVQKDNGVLVQEDWANANPDKVDWKKVAVISTKSATGADKDYLVPASSIQENLTKGQEAVYSEFMSRPTKKSTQQQQTTKKKISW